MGPQRLLLEDHLHAEEMKTTITINGLPVEFTSDAPKEDGLYWILDGIVQDNVIVENGYIETSGVMPSETNWIWSAPLIPSDRLTKAHELLTKITSSHFYQSSCRGGEMERLMNQAIQSVSAVNHNQSYQ